MTPELNQKHLKCRLSNHGARWHPWCTTIFWHAKKQSGCVAPWHSQLFSHTRKVSRLALPTLLECLKRKPWSSKEPDLHVMRSYVKLQRFQMRTPSFPYSRNTWLQGILAQKEKRKNTCSGGKNVKSMSCPEYKDFVVCDTCSGARWFLSMCGEWDDTCGVRWRLWSAQVPSKRIKFWICVPRKAKRDGQKMNSQSQPQTSTDSPMIFVFCFHTMQNFTGQTIPFTLSWSKVAYQNPGLEYQ